MLDGKRGTAQRSLFGVRPSCWNNAVVVMRWKYRRSDRRHYASIRS
ncbi:hypothetical protein ACVPOR_00520 [Staphylococcus aureus]